MADKHTARKYWRCTLERAEKFISPLYFSDVNLFSRLYPKKAPVMSITHFAAPGRISCLEAMKGTFLPVKVGDSFGPTWSTHWFQVQVDVPEEWGGEEVHLRWNSNSEAMVWQEGKPMQGLTGADGHQQRTDFVLSTRAVPSERITVYIEMAANGMFGAGKGGLINAPDPKRRYSLSMAEIAVFNTKCYEILQDLTVILDLAKYLPEGSPRAYDALYTANEIVNACDVTDQESFTRCHEIARRFLSQRNGDSQQTVHAIGNCHIDSAWLWPVAETVRKCGRSFSTAVRLMEKYPEFRFVCSQMQQLAWVKESYPALYQEIRGRATTGQFIPVGGTWIEMDGNIPSGESFIRQFLVGQKFAEAEFGHTCDEFWLPDTFGYSAQLPQIMNGAGIKYFLTQKLSWSLINKFPFHTFYWEGIDGSRCLAHFPPADTYESRGNVEDVLKTVSNLKDKGRVHDSILLFGHGDGGGGPAEEMLEMLRRMKDVDGCPRVKFSTPKEFFHSVDAKSSKNLCTWVGELYLELHQGTFTTQAEIKRGNRQGEFLIHNAELVSTLAWALVGKSPEQYPSGELLRIWKLLLLNQFHDILPGTSIREAVQDALNDYKDIHSSAKRLFQDGFHKLISNLNPNTKKILRPVVVNTLCWERIEIVVVPKMLWDTLSKQEQNPLRSQILTNGDVLVQVKVPSMGISTLKGVENVAHQDVLLSTDGGSTVLENSLLRLELDSAGRVTSLTHKKSNKNAIRPGRLGNVFALFDDIPLFWDAWDVMPYHLEKRKIISEPFGPNGTLQIIESGPLAVAVESSLKISEQSFVRQVISLEADCPFVRFHTKVEWHENRKLLKVEFPVDVRAMSATYEIQCGHLQRPTHCNTSWDWAKYEVCGHKWADVSEYDWGVSLMTDSKYGYSTHGSEMFISLLRSPKAPDDQADMGQHEFAYALFPHSGTFQSAGLVQHAYNFNESVHVIGAEVVEDFISTSFFSVDSPSVVLETVKKAEEVPSAMVVRLYEAFGGRSRCRLSSPLNITAVKRCNLLEVPDKGTELSWINGGVEIALRPFQIVSLLLYLE